MPDLCNEKHPKHNTPCVLDTHHLGKHRTVVVAGPPPQAVIEWAPTLAIAAAVPTSERKGG